MPSRPRKTALSLRRRAVNVLATVLLSAAALLVLAPLVAVFVYVVYRGIGALNLAFLTQTPKPVGEPGGGMANAIVGSGVILLIGSCLGVPLGVGAGTFLAEYGSGRLGTGVRITA